MDYNLKKDIYKLFEDEINISNFQNLNATATLEAFIIFKYLNTESPINYKYENLPLNIAIINEATDFEQFANCILIGNIDVSEEDFKYNDLASAFINRYLNNENEPDYKFYINAKNRVIYIYQNNSAEYIYTNQFEQSFILLIGKIAPFYFGELDKDKMIALISDMAKELEEKYSIESIFGRVINQQGLINKVMHNRLLSMSDSIITHRTQSLIDELSRKQSYFANLINELSATNNKIKQLKNEIAAIKLSRSDYENPINEIIEFLQNTNENIELDSIEDFNCKFRIKTTLNQIDDKELKIVLNNKHSYFYFNLSYSEENKRLFETLLLNEEYKIHTITGVSLNLINGQINGFKPHNEIVVSDDHLMPQPHLGGNGGGIYCFGDAAYNIEQYVLQARYVEALNQIIFAAKQFTPSDTFVGEILLRNLDNYSCIEMPNGEFVNLEGYRSYMVENEGE